MCRHYPHSAYPSDSGRSWVRYSAAGFPRDFLGLGWRMIFLANMPICLIAGIGCRSLPTSPNAAHGAHQKQLGNPLRLFRYRGYTVGIFLNVCLYAAIVPFFVVLGLYLQNICELSPQTAGLVFMAVGTGFVLASSAVPALMRRRRGSSLWRSALDSSSPRPQDPHSCGSSRRRAY